MAPVLFLTSIWQRLTRNTAANNNAIQSELVRQDNVAQLNDIVRQPATILQDNIVLQPGAVFQDITHQPENILQDDIIRQPVMVLQDNIIRQPAELIFQENTIDQLDSDERSLFVDGTSLDFIYWNP